MRDGVNRIGSTGGKKPVNGDVNRAAGRQADLELVDAVMPSAQHRSVRSGGIVRSGGNRRVVIHDVAPSIPRGAGLSDALRVCPSTW